MVVEFAHPDDANATIKGGLVWEAELLICELYTGTGSLTATHPETGH